MNDDTFIMVVETFILTHCGSVTMSLVLVILVSQNGMYPP